MNSQKEHIMQFFAYAHLPHVLQEVSKPFAEMADRIIQDLPRNPERTVALRKLLESKDAAVRAKLAKDESSPPGPPGSSGSADPERPQILRVIVP